MKKKNRRTQLDEATEMAPEQAPALNAWRVYHVETGEALATHEDAAALAQHLSEMKSGDALLVRMVAVDKA